MRWMKLSGIIGIFFLILSIISFILSFLANPVNLLSVSQSPNLKFVFIGFFLVFLVAFFFFYYGFVKMGKFTKIKLLSVSSWLIISFVGALTLLMVGLILWLFSQPDLLNAMSSLLGMVYYVLLFLLAMAVAIILFYVGLIKARDQVRFAKLGGIFGFVTLGAVLLLIPFYANVQNLFVFTILDFVLGSVLMIMMILSLFDASKKFEGGNVVSPQETINQTATKPVAPQTSPDLSMSS